MFIRILIIINVFISAYTKALTVSSIASGDWENPSTWSTQQVPASPDSIIISHYVTLNQNLTISSPTVLFINASGTVCGNYLMETLCGASFVNYGYMYLNQIKTRSGANYNKIQCKSSITLLGCSSGGGSFNSYPPNGHVEVWPPVFCKTHDTNWESGTLAGFRELENSTLTVFPNPLKEGLLTLITKGNSHFTLTDAAGNIMIKDFFKDTTLLDISALPNGPYFLELETEGKKQTRKIIKLH